MDYLHSIGFFYGSEVLTPKYGPVQIIDDYYPPRHG